MCERINLNPYVEKVFIGECDCCKFDNQELEEIFNGDMLCKDCYKNAMKVLGERCGECNYPVRKGKCVNVDCHKHYGE